MHFLFSGQFLLASAQSTSYLKHHCCHHFYSIDPARGKWLAAGFIEGGNHTHTGRGKLEIFQHNNCFFNDYFGNPTTVQDVGCPV